MSGSGEQLRLLRCARNDRSRAEMVALKLRLLRYARNDKGAVAVTRGGRNDRGAVGG